MPVLLAANNALFLPGLLLLAGISIFASINYFFLWIKKADRYSNLSFAVVALLASVYIFLNYQIYQTALTETVCTLFKWQFITVILFYSFFIWFIHEYGEFRKGILFRILIAINALYLILSFTSPCGFLYTAIETASPLTFSWGESIYLFSYKINGFIGHMGNVVMLFYNVFPIYLGILLYKKHRTRGKVLMIGGAIFLLASVNDILVSENVYRNILLADYGFVLLLITLSYGLAVDWFNLNTSLEQSRIELKVLNRDLERTVDERTKDLNRTITELKKLSGAITQSPTSVVITNSEGAIEYVNPVFSKTTGYSFEEAIGQNPRILKSGRQSDQFYKELWSTITKGEIWHGDFENKKKNGQVYWERAAISPITNEEGTLINFVAVKQDITERKRIEQAIDSSLQLLGLLECGSTDTIIEFGLRELSRLSGSPISFFHYIRDDEEVIDFHAWHSTDHKEIGFEKKAQPLIYADSGFLKDPLLAREAMIQGELVDVAVHDVFPGEDVVLTSSIAIPIFDGDKIVAVTGVANGEEAYQEFDIIQLSLLARNTWSVIQRIVLENELKTAKETTDEINRTLEFFQYAVDNAVDFANWLDHENSEIRYINRTGSERLGYTKEELIGKPIGFIDFNFPEEKWESFKTELAKGEAMKFDTTQRSKDGEEIPLEITAQYVEFGDIKRVIAFGRDITERKEYEAQLKEAIVKADAANMAKSTFLANMSHEIRTPMNAILGHTQILQRDEQLSKEQKKSIQSISKSGEHLLSLINDILDMSKIEAGKIKILPASFNIRTLLQEQAEMFKFPADKKNLSLDLDISGDFPEFIFADENRIRQVLINLMSNAVKFTNEGGVHLGARIEDEMIKISIRDSGIGINPKNLHRIFEAFEQTEKGSRTWGGTGLGLAISKRIAELMDGTIQVKSVVDEGSEFTFIFNYVIGEIKESATAEDQRRIKSLAQGQPTIKVLIVDDKFENREVASILLKKVGFEVGEATNGVEAIEQAKKWKPDLILMDIVMPVMGGAEASEIIKESDYGKSIRIIALSASALDEEREYVLEHGVDLFIKKPFKQEELFTSIGKLLELEYQYEEIELEKPKAAQPVELDGISSALRAEMSKAALVGNVDRIEELISELKKKEPEVFQYLTGLLANFELDTIQKLLKE